ncbi:MAG: hypothetical protein KC457_27440, partial [Myxococcales bacterium]|nr:hypothetical protein [Myxococcales bacterium]
MAKRAIIREPAPMTTVTSPPSSRRQTLLVSADGAAGRDGHDGVDGWDGGTGSDGGDGSDAQPAGDGQPGGDLGLRLRPGSEAGHYQITVAIRSTGGAVEDARLLPDAVDLRVVARGGSGGTGGSGGNGGDGGTGHRGSDATRYRHGEDGGRGGDGGDGGRGSDGGDGGKGGHIRIQVAEDDTYLLMTIEGAQQPTPLVAGGKGGRPGSHGIGGAGGSGGSGGSSYHWTETQSYTDSNGQTQTRSTHHHTPGGSRGSSGSSGRSPNSRLDPGRDGDPGGFAIEVVDDHGQGVVARYQARYDLALDDFSFREAETPTRDGILEFGEVVEVGGLWLRNIGAMPTPARRRVRLTLGERDWLIPAEDQPFLPRSLAPGEAIEVPGTLRFAIPRPQIDEPGDPAFIREQISPIAEQLGPEPNPEDADTPPSFVRPYANVTLTREFIARFPVENGEGIRVLQSLAPGERSRIVFPVSNVSKLALGSQSSNKRQVRVQLELTGGDLEPEQLRFVDDQGNPHLLRDGDDPHSGYSVDLPLIPAGGSVEISGEIGFVEGVPAYAGAELTFSLWLESLALDGALELIQLRRVTLRVEPAYVATPGARVLLLTHNQVSRAAYLAWNELLEQRLELATDEWSLARYGHFDHEQRLPEGDLPLYTQLIDKLVIVIDSPFAPTPEADDDRRQPTAYLRGQDFRRSVTQRGTRYLVIHFLYKINLKLNMLSY